MFPTSSLFIYGTYTRLWQQGYDGYISRVRSQRTAAVLVSTGKIEAKFNYNHTHHTKNVLFCMAHNTFSHCRIPRQWGKSMHSCTIHSYTRYMKHGTLLRGSVVHWPQKYFSHPTTEVYSRISRLLWIGICISGSRCGRRFRRGLFKSAEPSPTPHRRQWLPFSPHPDTSWCAALCTDEMSAPCSRDSLGCSAALFNDELIKLSTAHGESPSDAKSNVHWEDIHINYILRISTEGVLITY